MKKALIVITAAVFVLALSACADISIHYSVDEQNAVVTEYTVTLDKATVEDEPHYAYYETRITTHWKNQGMETSVEENGNKLVIKGKKTVQAQGPREAFEELKKQLTGDNSDFVSLEYGFAESYLDYKYRVSGTISLEDILRTDNNDKYIPAEILDNVRKKAEAATYTVRLTLPGTIISSNAEGAQAGQPGTAEWKFGYGEKADIKLETVFERAENVEYYVRLQEVDNLFNILFYVFIGAAGLAVIVFLIIFFVRRRRK